MNDIATAFRSLARQEQFLDVVDRDTATGGSTAISICARSELRRCRYRRRLAACWRVRLSAM
jgi:hypothetical protein